MATEPEQREEQGPETQEGQAEGEWDRRKFLVRAAVLGLSSSSLIVFIQACASGGTPLASPTSPPLPTGSTADVGGTIKWADADVHTTTKLRPSRRSQKLSIRPRIRRIRPATVANNTKGYAPRPRNCRNPNARSAPTAPHALLVGSLCGN